MAKTKTKFKPIYGCQIRFPKAAARAVMPSHLAVLIGNRWPGDKVDLTVSFMGSISQSLAQKILDHANAWSRYSNIHFHPTNGTGQVRIAFANTGYWSYLGTDILGIAANQPTMNLQGFNRDGVPTSEYLRVVPHEFGHTAGFPHEHTRPEIINELDYAKTLAYFERTQGWSERDVIQQVLTPLDEKTQIMGTPHADETSVMAYSFPGSITKSGKPIPGGVGINGTDGAFAGTVYPLAGDPGSPPPPPPPQPPAGKLFSLTFNQKVRKGYPVMFRTPVEIPAGTYDLVPAVSADVKAAQATTLP